MNNPKPFFVTATESEAARVAALGYEAVPATEDAANVALRTSQDAEAGTAILILANEVRQQWADAFEAAGHPYAVADARMYALAYDGGADLAMLVRADYEAAANEFYRKRWDLLQQRMERYHVHDTMDVAMQIYGGDADSEPIPTGISSLDKAIGGGMPQGGLTVIGAGSSNGKTTLVNQIGDALAAIGYPVVFVTIEQSRHELVAKSLSRMMRQTPKGNGGYYVASAAHIRSAKERASWPYDKEAALLQCCTRYSETVAPHMHIMEMSGQPTMEDIRRAYEAVEAYEGSSMSRETAHTVSGKPILIVDYLQLIRAKDERMTERKAIDVNVMALRQLARDKQTAVIVISSINRQSYSEGAGMSAFKESGAIEFSADLALMLQPRGFSEKMRGVKSEKAAKDAAQEVMEEHKGKARRQSEIVVLKNRGGAMPSKPVPLDYDAMCNWFTEPTGTPEPTQGKKVLI